jgi:hypothetical protein
MKNLCIFLAFIILLPKVGKSQMCNTTPTNSKIFKSIRKSALFLLSVSIIIFIYYPLPEFLDFILQNAYMEIPIGIKKIFNIVNTICSTLDVCLRL